MRKIIIGDTEYEVDRYYREGAQAYRDSIPWTCNPYREGSYRNSQWSSGHEHESAGEHEGLQ